jgi:hypothetical protein
MTQKKLAASITISFLTAAGLTLLDVAALRFYVADDVAVGDFRVSDKPRSCLLFQASETSGGTEVKSFDVTFRGITEQSHRLTVQLPQHLARCRIHLALHHEYSAAALNSKQTNTASLPATLEREFGIDAMKANQ